ncbi:MAG: ubiquinol-cytochrome c reductase iron-sulfur subunit [Alphaproteobacteria bacterium]|jgi:ubiquinol-cytochrome c reductase iron-sulfur subunit|nr:ubiquinol-cytochrome c reductase iron-sulfur subunit [Alphaproteobacteria bacterium]MBT5827866.1 ubiquinol-cytochrome c reductase iron-sulfur subunit [Alphaproteobacteria bacterium]
MGKNTKTDKIKATESENVDGEKRDFVVLAATAMAGVGAASVAVPFVHSMNPAKDVKALASIEVDISGLESGDEMKVKWRGKPVFIKRRSEAELAEAREVDINSLIDPQTDEERVKKGKEEYLIVLGVCTHLGCVPLGKGSGDYNAWFCPCHGSHYDISGRIRKGPAPKNLIVPEYNFVTDKVIKIG